MCQLDIFSAPQSSTEGIDIAFKSASAGMPGSFWKSYSVVVNVRVGTIVFGVAEESFGLGNTSGFLGFQLTHQRYQYRSCWRTYPLV